MVEEIAAGERAGGHIQARGGGGTQFELFVGTAGLRMFRQVCIPGQMAQVARGEIRPSSTFSSEMRTCSARVPAGMPSARKSSVSSPGRSRSCPCGVQAIIHDFQHGFARAFPQRGQQSLAEVCHDGVVTPVGDKVHVVRRDAEMTEAGAPNTPPSPPMLASCMAAQLGFM